MAWLLDHTQLLIALSVGAMAVVVLVRLSRAKSSLAADGKTCRPLPPKTVQFKDMAARAAITVSGEKPALAVYVWVADGEVAVETPFPFNILADSMSALISRRIPIAAIQSLSASGNVVKLRALGSGFKPGEEVLLDLRKPDEFIAVLKGANRAL